MFDFVHRASWVSRGSIFDANEARIKRELKAYDPNIRLYWNPDYKKGQGGWELHWSPTWEKWAWQGDLDFYTELFTLEKVQPTKKTKIHFDIPYLNSNLVQDLRDRDTWSVSDKTKAADAVERLFQDQEQSEEQKMFARIKDDTKAALREEKKYISQFKDFVSSGVNPAWFLKE